MATKRIVRHVTVSDLSGLQGASVTRFSYRGRAWEIDLTSPERATLRSLVKVYGSYGRRIPAGTDRERRQYFTEARRWGREQGMEVSDRGHVPKALLEAYEATQAEGSSQLSAAPGPGSPRRSGS